jgi:hypothetical protein
MAYTMPFLGAPRSPVRTVDRTGAVGPAITHTTTLPIAPRFAARPPAGYYATGPGYGSPAAADAWGFTTWAQARIAAAPGAYGAFLRTLPRGVWGV